MSLMAHDGLENAHDAHEIQKSWKSAHENEPVETQRSQIFDFFSASLM